MPDSLTVDVNRKRLHHVEVPDRFVTDESFVVDLVNRGESVHVHLHLDDALSQVATLEGGNHYVERGSTRSVEIDVAAVREPVTGKLKLVTGYGAEVAYVDVTVEPLAVEKEPVDVDEALGRPRRPEPGEEPLVERLRTLTADVGTLSIAGFGIFAIVLALGVGVVVDSAAVLLGVGVVIGGVLAALVLLTR
ncbi:DUF7524 family protein [Halegenticoccus tardaugens]|uniref:DUF7524 family protein n=1 Tax=Halegenticoccus tardaugens TaxID=2071624 RepID=UPI00100B0540|nr:hypothetical protein [Halegenticoccus tardaugens]